LKLAQQMAQTSVCPFLESMNSFIGNLCKTVVEMPLADVDLKIKGKAGHHHLFIGGFG